MMNALAAATLSGQLQGVFIHDMPLVAKPRDIADERSEGDFVYGPGGVVCRVDAAGDAQPTDDLVSHPVDAALWLAVYAPGEDDPAARSYVEWPPPTRHDHFERWRLTRSTFAATYPFLALDEKPPLAAWWWDPIPAPPPLAARPGERPQRKRGPPPNAERDAAIVGLLNAGVSPGENILWKLFCDRVRERCPQGRFPDWRPARGYSDEAIERIARHLRR